MKIAIPIQLVPDLVEELLINDEGTGLDTTWLRMIVNEFDDHALEEGILLKERMGAEVAVIAPDIEGADDVLFSAAAKGADQILKLTGDFENVSNHTLAQVFSNVLNELEPSLVLTGVQAHDDLDGQLGSLLAGYLNTPYVGYVSGMEIINETAVVTKEYPGGLLAEMEVTLPAVFGIQAAEEPPRYVAFSKIRQAMKSATIEEIDFPDLEKDGPPQITEMYKPEVGERAEMIKGDLDQITDKLLEIFREKSIL